MDGQKSRGHTSVRFPDQSRGKCVDRLGVERGVSIFRIGLESEQFASSAGPVSASGVILVGTERFSHHAAIAQSMENRTAAMEFDPAQDVAVVTYDDVRSGVDGAL
jgi:hypothetical protein